MADAPRVSVIMPFLNAMPFITEAIESVFAQTYDAWELLLIDDGSTDASTSVARRYAEEYPERIRYLEHDGHHNRGQSASRNLGFTHARGHYVAPLDADDIWLPDKLKQQVRLLDGTAEADALFGATYWWYSWTGAAEDRERDFVAPIGYAPGTVIQPPSLLMDCFSERVPIPLTSTMLMRRSSVVAVGGFQEEFRFVYTDRAFFTKFFLTASTLVSDACWTLYRRHSNSVCVVARGTGELDAAEAMYLDWSEEYLAQQRMQGTGVWAALQARRWRYRHPHLARLRRGFASLPGRITRGIRAVLPA